MLDHHRYQAHQLLAHQDEVSCALRDYHLGDLAKLSVEGRTVCLVVAVA